LRSSPSAPDDSAKISTARSVSRGGVIGDREQDRSRRTPVPNAFISGTGAYVPPRIVTNDDLRTQYGIDTTHEWIAQRTGIEARRFAEEGQCSADLAVPAALQAIERAGLQKTDIDMIVFATLSPKHAFPGDGVYLQQKLGLCDEGRFIPATDVR